MICKMSTALFFKGITITDELLQSIRGLPVTDKGKEIGTILRADHIHIVIEISDDYKDRFVQDSSFEIVGG